MKKQFMTPLIIFGFLVVLLVVGLMKAKYVRDVPSPLIGKPVPEFSIPTVGDQQKNFSSEELKGQVSLVNIWASWCVSCRAEHRLLNALAQQGINIYGINYKDELVDARGWLSAYGNPYIKSAHDISGRTGIDWGVYGTPETFVIDNKGMIRYKHTGPIYQDDITEKVLPLIEQLKAEQLKAES
ncbi:MAG: DsbE family thiol:disulfide interchange protein [gamma proteobacterium symbiont of Taylorina sp.]|nr:DsbE family thiol:disulfide interchange protein [gamma proteobacterium symbiont of Taylorina sp.]